MSWDDRLDRLPGGPHDPGDPWDDPDYMMEYPWVMPADEPEWPAMEWYPTIEWPELPPLEVYL